MSLSNLDKNNINNLLLPIINLDLTNNNELEKIKKNSATYAQLKLIVNQVNILKEQANNILNEARINDDLHNIECRFKKVSGNIYHLYKKNDKKYFSLLSPKEWNHKDEFICSYYYDYDKTFISL